MKSPLEDTIWGAHYGSVAAVQAAFDRFGTNYHHAIMASGAPQGAAAALMPHLVPHSQGIDLGCGTGVLGLELRRLGVAAPLDGIDVSSVMLNLAHSTNCYRTLVSANLLLPESCPALPKTYDFAVTLGLIGDYVPYYVALPYIVSLLREGAWIGFGVESRSTPQHPLRELVEKLGLRIVSETELPVPEDKLAAQVYQFFVARLERGSQP